jgi:aryl-alcohol dehydrogenase-like predicted oxidoreductase
MRTVKLPAGEAVPALGLGTWRYGEDRSRRAGEIATLKLALDLGVTLIDTAEMYGEGAAEEVIGEALAGRRDQAFIVSKVYPHNATRKGTPAACERSLKRLRTDWIDLYQLHQWDGETPVEETMEVLDTLVKSGKVRYVGCSNFSGWHIMKAMGAAKEGGYQPFVSQQIHYTLQAREAEYELVPISLDQGLGILVWSPIAGGLLSGKFRRGKKGPEGSRHFALKHREPPIYDAEKLFDIVEVLVEIGKEHNCSAARVALAWLLARPGVSSVIIGGRTPEQFADNLAAADLKLSEEQTKRLEEASRPPLLYPYWHQAWAANDRLGAADLTLLAPHLS